MSIWGGLIGSVGKVVDELHTSGEERAAAELAKYKAETERLEVTQRERLAQVEVNLADAKSGSKLQAGWRPSVGWACVSGLTYSVLLQPLLAWVSPAFGIGPPPVIDTGILLSTLGALLGVGSLRTYEKVKGVQHRH